MALDFSSMMLNPSPAVRLDGAFGGGGSGLERERLKLMREQFEQSKLESARNEELRRMEEQGRSERQRLQAEADKAAQTKKDRLAAYQTFTEANGKGDIEGGRAMLPMMNALGMDVELEGEVDGLPRYRVNMDAQEQAEAESLRVAKTSPYGPRETAAQSLDRMGGLGYPSDDSGTLPQQPGIASTEDAYSQALAASQYAEENGTPARGPDEPDYTGAVPKNVIDTGAMADQTLARLDPALSGMVGAYPEAYQDSARQTAAGIRGLGLPAEKSAELFLKSRTAPDSAIESEATARANAAKEAYARRTGADKEAFDRYDVGFNKLGKELATQYDIDARLRTRSLNQQALEVLTNKTQEDDMLVLSLISRGFGERGATTEGDVARAIGLPATSTWDQITGWFTSRLEGGLPPKAKVALTGVLKKAIEANDGELGTFSDRVRELADDPETDPDAAKGLRDYWRGTVPKEIRARYEATRGSSSGGRGRSADLDMTGVEGGAIAIPETSRIAKVHNNPGNLKFVGQEGASEGEPAGDGGTWAKFDTPEAGMKALLSQIGLDADRGLTLREFITKYAPPGSNDTEQYIEQAVSELKAQADDLLSEVDPYDALRFVARKESGTLLPSQYEEDEEDDEKLRMESLWAQADAPEPAAAAPAEDPGAARRKRIEELRRKAAE
jgi:hypothetical protein